MIIGMDDLIRDLEKMGAQADMLMEKALIAGAEILEELLREAAPVYDGPPLPHVTPGQLKAAIQKGEIRQDRQGRITIAIGPEKGDISAAYYGKFSEYGTSHEVAKPWARPAFDLNVEKVADVMEKVLMDGIEEFFSGG